MIKRPVTINHLMACAMVECCTLADAAKKIDAPQEVLFDAVAMRMSVAVDQDIRDYHESITAAFRRLEAAN